MSKIMELAKAYKASFGIGREVVYEELQAEVTRVETEFDRLTTLAHGQHVELYNARLKLAALEALSDIAPADVKLFVMSK